MDSNIVVEKVTEYLEEKKAKDIRIIDVTEVTVIAEQFIICTGTSTTHVKALAHYVDKQLRAENVEKLRAEGNDTGNWILLDYGDVVVHIFKEEEREFYNLEKLWAEGKFKTV